MKYLGIDYGAKHVGLALSDSGGNVAMPHSVVPNDGFLFSTIVDLVRDEDVEKIIIGESHNLDMGHNEIQFAINQFRQQLEQDLDLPVEYMNELFSSRQAKWGVEHALRINPRNLDKRNLHKKQRRIDDRAATIILQSYLDSQT